jgi:hypothetical protein
MKPISSTIHAEGDNASSICDNRKQPAKFILNNKLNSKYEQFKLRQITATIADNIGVVIFLAQMQIKNPIFKQVYFCKQYINQLTDLFNAILFSTPMP